MKSETIKKLEQREHILLRKTIFIGNCKTVIEPRWIIENNKLQYKDMPYNEGYLKLIYEIIDNSVDEYLKTKGKYGNKISVDIAPDLTIKVTDNGRGLSSKKDTKSGKYQVELAFCELNTGSNWERDVSIGMNGLGSALTNFLSEFFNVVTCDGVYQTTLKCSDHCQKIDLKRKKLTKRGTVVEFKIDSSQFENIEYQTLNSIQSIVYKRLIEIHTAYPKIQIMFNGQKIQTDFWKFLPDEKFTFSKNNVLFYAYYAKERAFQDISYVNGLDVYKGGSHIKYFKAIFNKTLKELISKKYKIDFKHMSYIYNNFQIALSLINFPQPEFNTQNKTELINSDKELKDFFDKNGLNVEACAKAFVVQFKPQIEKIVESLQNDKLMTKVKKQGSETKKTKQLSNFMDAVDKDRRGTIFFLVEGDSATSHFPIVRDKNKHGLMALKGKVINAYNNTLEKVFQNKEIVDLVNILGLDFNKKTDTKYFEKIALLMDADVDGDHIAIMLLLFFYKYFPFLYRQGRIIKILSPIIIARKGKQIKRFYRYEEFLKEQTKLKDWSIEYNKGLGSLTEEEYEHMLKNPIYDVLSIDNVEKIDLIIECLFDKKTTDERKAWLQGINLQEVINGTEKNPH